jgi:hypothetical protein
MRRETLKRIVSMLILILFLASAIAYVALTLRP